MTNSIHSLTVIEMSLIKCHELLYFPKWFLSCQHFLSLFRFLRYNFTFVPVFCTATKYLYFLPNSYCSSYDSYLTPCLCPIDLLYCIFLIAPSLKYNFRYSSVSPCNLNSLRCPGCPLRSLCPQQWHFIMCIYSQRPLVSCVHNS